ncbi:AAA family ATPase [Sphingopyxis fribergensis]
MLEKLVVERLRGVNSSRISLEFKPGLNLLTGKNGSGKTTILKLLWYLVSGNINRATDETRFGSLSLKTDEYSLVIENSTNRAKKITIEQSDGTSRTLDQDLDEDGDPFWDEDIEDEANKFLVDLQRTVYFPTFRRIEGGYGISTSRSARLNKQNDIEMAFENLSRKLSNGEHRFVAFVSTSDISRMLLEKYTEISGEINKLQSNLSGKIISQIKNYQIDDEADKTGSRAKLLLEDVKQAIEKLDEARKSALQPMDAIQSIVSEIFEGKSIKIGSALNFGDAAVAISSEHLSAGEKQMLSFLCYNALFDNTVLFIDEPELSLHPDWQRILFRVLENQNPTNQFIISTHSPFIYSKFPEREIKITSDLGNEMT